VVSDQVLEGASNRKFRRKPSLWSWRVVSLWFSIIYSRHRWKELSLERYWRRFVEKEICRKGTGFLFSGYGRVNKTAVRSQTMKEDFLRFSGAVERNPAIDAWIKRHPAELGAIAREWFEAMRRCGDEVRELMHDGCPVACLGDAPFGYVNVFTSHVNVGFFHGAALPDPARLLEGAGKRMRHVKLRPGVPTDTAALGRLVEQAYSDIKSRVENG
jgi:hypothetical protein